MALDDVIDVKIVVDERDAIEYPSEPQVDEMAGRQVLTKYVEVVSGAQFAFKATISPRYRYGQENSLTMTVYIDGNYAGGVVWARENHSHLVGSTITVACRWEGVGRSTQKVLYHFADLETRTQPHDLLTAMLTMVGHAVDADELKEMKAKYNELGTLKAVFHREMMHGLMDSYNPVVNNTGVVPEKALKGRSLDVSAQYVSLVIKTSHTADAS